MPTFSARIRRAMRRRAFTKRKVLRSVAAVVFLTIFAAVVIIPFLYMLVISFKNDSEIGDPHFLPYALREMTRPGKKAGVWLEAELTAIEAAGYNSILQIPATPGSPAAEIQPGAPADAAKAAKIALDRPAIRSDRLIALLRVDDPNEEFSRAGVATIYFPVPDSGQTQTAMAKVIPRTMNNLLGRLLINYRKLLKWDVLSSGSLLSWISSGYPRWYFNSLFIAFATVALGVFFDSLAAFAFAKFEFPFRKVLFGILLATIMIPYPVTLVPTFFIFAKLGFYNTYAALIIPGMVSAFGIFLVRQYLLSVPDEMLEAARVDGATDFSLYRHIILPTAAPVLAALAIFRFIFQWNSYLYPLVLTNRDTMKTVQLGLATMVDAHGMVDYGDQMAGAALAVLPILIVYSILQRHFIAGITMGSVKE